MPNSGTEPRFLAIFHLIKKAFSAEYSVKQRPRSEENAMRTKRNNQNEFSFQAPSLKITREYYERYERISRILDGASAINCGNLRRSGSIAAGTAKQVDDPL